MIPLQSSLFTKDALTEYAYMYVFVGRGARGRGGGDLVVPSFVFFVILDWFKEKIQKNTPCKCCREVSMSLELFEAFRKNMLRHQTIEAYKGDLRDKCPCNPFV